MFNTLCLKQNNPLVSIVFLAYNQEKFIEEALEGIISQTYDNLEVIILDDASDDKTLEIIHQKICRYSGEIIFKVIQNEKNLGGNGIGSFIKGVNISQGEFIIISCGDDIAFPNLVSELASEWINRNVSLVTSNAILIDSNSNELGGYFRDPSIDHDISIETLVRDGANALCFGAGMGFTRELYNKFGCPPAYLGATDIMFSFYSLLLNGAYYIKSPLLKYRVHNQNTSVSIILDQGDTKIKRLVVEENMHFIYGAHALLMEECLNELVEQDPQRYGEIRHNLIQLIQIHLSERMKKLARARISLHDFGEVALAVSGHK